MAKQAGPFFFTGTLGDVIFYKSGEQYLVRMKGSYNTKALQKPGARPLMQLRQQEFGQASKLASRVRRQLPLVKRREVTIGSLTREARKLLREGRPHEEIKALLMQQVATILKPATTNNVNKERVAGAKKKPLKKQHVLPAIAPSLVSLPTPETIYREPLHQPPGTSQTAALETFYRVLTGHAIQLSSG